MAPAATVADASPATLDRRALVALCINTSLFVMVGVLIVAAAIHVRATVSAPAPPFVRVWLWQAVSWLPWFALAPMLALTVRTGRVAGFPVGLAQHVAASLLVAGLSTVWFSGISSLLSPFLGAADTRFGVFRWFFVFWALASFLGYWAITGFSAIAWPPPVGERTAPTEDPGAHDTAAALPTGVATPPMRLALESGGATHLVAVDDIDWIEAQDYYAVVHAGERAIWVKRSLDDLGASLETAGFVRVHRSTLVNLARVERLDKDARGLPVVVLRGGLQRRVSQTRWPGLRRAWPRR